MNTPTNKTIIPWKSRNFEIILLGIILAFSLFLLLFRLQLFPAPWFDEGLYTGTARTLVEQNRYSMRGAETYNEFHPYIQVGPTIVLPVAAAFSVFGVSLFQARVIIVLYSVIALIFFGILARKLLGYPAYLFAVLLLLIGNTEDFTSFVFLGRQMMGEVPALALLLVGMVVWLWTYEGKINNSIGWTLAGLFWGLSMMSKSQFFLVLPLFIGSIMVLGKYYYRQTGWNEFIIPGAVAAFCMGFWYLIQFLILGYDGFIDNIQFLREMSTFHGMTLDPIHWKNALVSIRDSGWWIWGLFATVWAVRRSLKRNRQGFYHGFTLTFPLIFFFWFFFLSIGWARYFFVPLVFSYIWEIDFLKSVWNGNVFRRTVILRSAVVAFLSFQIVYLGYPLLKNLYSPVDTGYWQMVSYLQNEQPKNAKIESWELELDLEIEQLIHHPPPEVLPRYITALYSNEKAPVSFYNPLDTDPEYLLVGPFGAWTTLYDPILDNYPVKKLVQFGQYALYSLE